MKNGMFGRIASSMTAFLLASIALPACGVSASDAVLLDFSSAHCGPCHAMNPVLAQLERQGVPVRHVDVNVEPNLARRYGVRQTPTFVVVSSGKEVTRLVGMQSASELLAALSINPQGPLVATGARLRNGLGSNGTPSNEPLTRLAPLRGRGFPQTLAAAPASNVQARNTVAQESHRGEPMPNVSIASAIQRAEAATVRLRVHDATGFGAGTGTIVDTHDQEALVLTCGHLFRENEGKGKIEVDIFVGGQVKTVLGQVIDYDSENRDIALVAIRPGFPVQPVPLLTAGQSLRTGQPVFSFGCDRGDDPTRRDTRITGVDKYDTHLGASNIEIAGAPVDGRSGGGLFDDQGRLVGVCNAADYKGDLGIYTGPGSVQWQLDRVNLSNLYKGSDAIAATNTRNASPRTNSPPAARIAAVVDTPRIDQSGTNPVRQASATEPLNLRPAPQPALGPGDREVIVIVRDRNNPAGQSQVITVREPTADLLDMIQRQAR